MEKQEVKITLERSDGKTLVWGVRVKSIVKARSVVRGYAESCCYACEWMLEGFGKVERGKTTIDEKGNTLYNQW